MSQRFRGLLLSVALIGCGLSSAEDQIEDSNAAISGGTLGVDAPFFGLPAAGEYISDGTTKASGTLVQAYGGMEMASHWVLSAYHITGWTDWLDLPRGRAVFAVDVLTRAGRLVRAEIPITDIIGIYPSDLALLRLAYSVPARLIGHRIPRIALDYPQHGSVVHAIGYGGDECDPLGENPQGGGVKRRARSIVERFELNELSFGVAGIRTCGGDSGGGLFSVDGVGRELEVIGTTEGVWSSGNFYTGIEILGTLFADAVQFRETIGQRAQDFDTAKGSVPTQLESIHLPIP